MTRFKGDSLPSYYIVNRRSNSLSLPPAPEPPCTQIIVDNNPRIVSEVPSQQPTNAPSKKQRPSLSEQLALISENAQKLVNTLQSKDTMSGKLTVPTASMTVGRLDCKFPSPVHFEDNVCRYQFLVASRDIAMFMYYCDMEQISFEQRTCSLKFKIGHALDEFGSDYDPFNRNHYITIGFACRSDFDRVKNFLHSKILNKPQRHGRRI